MYTYEYPRAAVTADAVIFRYEQEVLNVLLIERANEPFKGCWALPGGFMDMDEDAMTCAIRELKEETGLVVESMEQVAAFSDVDRDPRGRTVSITYSAVVTCSEVQAADDAAQVRWFPVDALPPLAFDHARILKEAIARL